MTQYYKIVRYYRPNEYEGKVVKRGLTRAAAVAHCADPETSSDTRTLHGNETRENGPGSWFDVFESEGANMYETITLTPAYGRDYTSKREALRDYNARKDFISQPDGRYCNIDDVAQACPRSVRIRYARLRKVMVVG